ncbi:MAG: hypothetical protein HY900_01950 [Deltaproteobacteria bacterium]|nr:hypothetical protein [Deltaproteobacteria bacterium]
MKVLIPWYSRTGTVERLVALAREALAEAGHEVTAERLVPEVDLPYPLWLLLSFVPGARSPLRNPPETEGYDRCLLALPKWTLACPPVNAFLDGRRLPPTALLVACGGWDHERYTTELVDRLTAAEIEVLGSLAVKQRRVADGSAEAEVRAFLARCFPA